MIFDIKLNLFLEAILPLFENWPILINIVSVLAFVIAFIFFLKEHKERLRMTNNYKDEKEALMRQINQITKKNKTNEEMLANMLPTQTANEIRASGKAQTHRFDMVTILFADIQGFTKIAEQMNPELLIDELDRIFFYFDSIAEKYNIEKIKTIGDAYMCAGGIPQKNKTNPVEVVLTALEMQNHLKLLHQENTSGFSKIWNLRIGVHTGPVIAGVVGKKKFSYDIWGDSVNVASRMESSGDIGRVNISNETYQHIKDFYETEYRGKMPVKYKGEIEMYFVNGIRTELSESNQGYIPNKLFKDKLALVRFGDLEETVLEKLKAELPDTITFHNASYASNLISKVELISLGEKVTDEEMLLLKTAALFYCTGYIESLKEFLPKSLKFANEILPEFDFNKTQIGAVINLINSTRQPFEPKNKITSIFLDAYNEYLGNYNYIEIADKMYEEYNAIFNSLSRTNYFHKQIQLIEKAEFFNNTAHFLIDVSKEEQIKAIQFYLQKIHTGKENMDK